MALATASDSEFAGYRFPKKDVHHLENELLKYEFRVRGGRSRYWYNHHYFD